ncbi:hypothetical protein GCM10022210_33060 [Mucilaginibacter dorajii]|uniref:Uncharacterized protein n=1 Tax=Mucilaginibacter dorajii TaxID=692994 RepID=A0ABP7QBJ1_9SPHI
MIQSTANNNLVCLEYLSIFYLESLYKNKYIITFGKSINQGMVFTLEVDKGEVAGEII